MEGLLVFLAGGAVLGASLVLELQASSIILLGLAAILSSAAIELQSGTQRESNSSTADTVKPLKEISPVTSEAQAVDVGEIEKVSVIDESKPETGRSIPHDPWAKYGVTSCTELTQKDEDFIRKRDAFRASLIVPGVSSLNAFDVRRQRLAEASLPALQPLIQAEYGHDAEALRFLTDIACYRFLRAREGNAEAAMTMIRTTIDWRRKKGLLSGRIVCKMCHDVHPRSHAYFFMGYDVLDRAVMYSSSARAVEQRDAESGVSHMVTEIEQELDDAKGVTQIVWVVDFQGFGASHADPRLGRWAIHLFQQVYPERLGHLVLLDFPYIFSIFFKIVAPLLDPVTRSKIVILRSKDDRKRYYQDHWTNRMIEWIGEVERTPAKPGLFPESHAIRGRYWT